MYLQILRLTIECSTLEMEYSKESCPWTRIRSGEHFLNLSGLSYFAFYYDFLHRIGRLWKIFYACSLEEESESAM
jgi:hypothetical protein